MEPQEHFLSTLDTARRYSSPGFQDYAPANTLTFEVSHYRQFLPGPHAIHCALG